MRTGKTETGKAETGRGKADRTKTGRARSGVMRTDVPHPRHRPRNGPGARSRTIPYASPCWTCSPRPATVTSTQAAARLGHSSGLCSFHLRQLARHGLIEEVPHKGGRARPWRLRWDSGQQPDEAAPEQFDVLARGLEDESYQHWLAHRDRAPAEWQHDESFSAVVHLTPAETAELAASIRLLLAGYRERDQRPEARPAGTVAVAAVTRLFPLLTERPAP